MNPVDQAIFEIISHTGAARSLLMTTIQAAQKGDLKDVAANLKTAQELQKNAQKAHLRLLNIPHPSLMMVHAEDQLMATELLLSLVPGILETNRRLQILEQHLPQG